MQSDGLLWSPSRIVGNFLVSFALIFLELGFEFTRSYQVYREINERSSSRTSHKKTYPLDSQSRCPTGPRSSPDHNATFKGPGHLAQGDHGTFKVNGLIKKVAIF